MEMEQTQGPTESRENDRKIMEVFTSSYNGKYLT